MEKLANSLSREGKTKVYRFTFDQPSPVKLTSGAHHAVDLIYLFGNIDFKSLHTPNAPLQVTPAGSSCGAGSVEEEEADQGNDHDHYDDSFEYWGAEPGEDEARVSEIMQAKWIEFVRGEEVWGEYVPYNGTSSTWASGSVTPSSVSSTSDFKSSLANDSHVHAAALIKSLQFTPMSKAEAPTREKEGEIYIFGPTGDAHAAPVSELGWRRRVDKWREAFGFEEDGERGDVGETVDLEDVIKVGMELANGPVTWGR